MHIIDILLPEQGMHGIFLNVLESIAMERQMKASLPGERK